MNVTVLIVAYHGDKWLPACLESLAEASAQRMHLLLVDNSGNSIIDRLDLSSFDVEVIRTPYPMGFAEANNYALIYASHLEESVLFLNQDTISTSGWVDACLRCFDEEEHLGAVSPLIRTYDGSGWDPSFLSCISDPIVLEDSSISPGEGIWFPTVNAPAPALILRTSVLREVGPFDPVFGSYYEDYDLCRRIREAGYVIGFCRSARIHHFSGSSTDSRERELKRMRQIIRNRLLYRLREHGGARWPLLLRHLLVDLPRNLGRGLLRTPSSQPLSVTFQAHLDLLQIAGRLVSRQTDEQAWQAYLAETGWPGQMSAVTAPPISSED